jgi:hypothetical protein
LKSDEGEAMKDFEYLQVVMNVAHLRSNPKYKEAELMRRKLGVHGAATMAKAPQGSEQYANIRLLIGTWNRISVFAGEFSAPQKRRFFKCHPVGLTWKVLAPGVEVIRTSFEKTDDVPEPVTKDYAKDLEALAAEYTKWTKTPDGKEYQSEARQAVCADFG